MTRDDERLPRGLPDRLPEGEQLVWQGEPRWRSIARDALHVRKVAFYFALLMAWRSVEVGYDGGGMADMIMAVSPLIPVALLALGLLCGLALLIARTTVYTLTDRRVVMTVGVALPITVNIPLHSIQSVEVARNGDGSGDIALGLPERDRIAYLHLWPHARAWKLKHPQPMFRGISDVHKASELLARMLGEQPPGASAQPHSAGPESQPVHAGGPLLADREVLQA